MPEICVGERRWAVPTGSNLLDALNEAGLNVPYSCRAGSCHACLVHCLDGLPADALPEALALEKHAQGWRLACQCRVVGDLRVAVFDPQQDGIPAQVCALDWFGDVLRLRLRPERAVRYQAGQHVVLWSGAVARPYSLASLPGEDDFLEFHIDCERPGAFCSKARGFKGWRLDALGGAQGRSVALRPGLARTTALVAGCGYWACAFVGHFARGDAAGASGEIKVMHVAHGHVQHYLAEPLQGIEGVSVELVLAEQLDEALAALRPTSRQTVALVCGSPASVEQFARRLFIAGVPRNQVFADVFVEHA